MATDFWSSSHFKRWTVDRATLKQARAEDLQYVSDPDHLALLSIFFTNLISKLCNKLSLRQRVIATASVFFKRFYLKNSYCETDPYIVLVACCYLAAKAEESPMHIKHVVSEARAVFNEHGIKNFPTDNSKLAEMEFYLIDDLECDLTVFHPYRTLMTLVKDHFYVPENEVGEWGVGIDHAQHIWGSGEPRLLIHTGGIQTAWFLINDSYGSDLCLLYPPHLIAIAALYLACILHTHTRRAHVEWIELRQQAATAAAAAAAAEPGPTTRRSSRHANTSSASTSSRDSRDGKDAKDTKDAKDGKEQGPAQTQTAAASKQAGPAQDFVGFFASLSVSMPLVATIAQEIISFYALCDRLNDDVHPGALPNPHWPRGQGKAKSKSKSQSSGAPSAASRSGSRHSSATPGSGVGEERAKSEGFEVNSSFLIQLLVKMRALRDADAPSSGRPAAINKMLERAQAAG